MGIPIWHRDHESTVASGASGAAAVVDVRGLRRSLALRALLAQGQTPAQVASSHGATLASLRHDTAAERTHKYPPSTIMRVGRHIIREFVECHGYTRLAMFGSAARGDDSPESDLDLIVTPPAGADLFELSRLERDLASIVGKSVDLVSSRGLDVTLDRDILSQQVLL